MSRLACVKAAIDLHLQRLARQHPQRRMCLITFASDVTIWGDGTTAPVTIAGDRLGQHVRNLFECMGLPEEGALLALECGERPDSPLR